MKKWICFFLSLLTTSCLFMTGCVDLRAPNGGFTLTEEGAGGGATTDEQKGTPFVVTLETSDGMSISNYEGVSVIWTHVSGENVYQAPVDKNGVATCYGPDGEYRVTLSKAPAGYAYNPNVYEADNKTPRETVYLFPVRSLKDGSTGNANGITPATCYTIKTTGVYRFTFTNANERFFFNYGGTYSGLMSFESLVDVTANEISPVFYDANTTDFPITNGTRPLEGGGSEGTYTKNFYCEYSFTSSQNKLFQIGLKAKSGVAFPITIDMLVNKEGEYTIPKDTLEKVTPPVALPAADALITPSNFTGFELLAKENGSISGYNEKVILHTDGYYYWKDADGTADLSKPLCAVLTRDVRVVMDTRDGDSPTYSTDLGMGLSYPLTRHTCYKVAERLPDGTTHSGKDYSDFIREYFKKTNADDVYPVNQALRDYLYDFCLSHQVFYDGNGSAEQMGNVNSDIDSFWLVYCGYYYV